MDGERCILDVIAGIDLYPFGAVADRPEISGETPPASYVPYATKPRPGWMVDAYLATKPGTAEAVNALAAAIVGGNERKPPAPNKAKGRQGQRKDRHGCGPRPADYTPDCPTPAEISRRCAAIRSTWTEQEHERRVVGQTEDRIEKVRASVANTKPPKPRRKRLVQVG